MMIHQQIPLPGIESAEASAGAAAAEPETEFNWNTDDSVVLNDQPATVVYVNKAGGVVIRQERSWDQEEDSVVYLSSREAVRTVIAALQRELRGR